jgi:flagellar export protein FliJ
MKPLKRLLKIRIDVEKNLRIALAKAISERTLFQRELNEKKQRFMGVSDDFLGILEEGVMVQHLAHFLQYLSGARETIEEDEKVLKKLEEKEEKVRGEVIEAKR